MFPKQAQMKDNRFSEFDSELRRTGVKAEAVFSRYGIKNIDEMTPELLDRAINSLKRTKTKSA